VPLLLCRFYAEIFPSSRSPWGSFVEAKINIAEVLNFELQRKKRPGTALLSSVCDPYQPLENRFQLTRACLEVLRKWGWGIDILTKSPLVIRDLDIFSTMPEVSVGFSIPTDDDEVRKVLEPNAPPIGARLSALKTLHEAGISIWVFIAPILPMNPIRLHEAIAPYAAHLMVDSLNYRSQVKDIFSKHHWNYEFSDQYATETGSLLMQLWERRLEK
jgi:DNA repair photolyase